MRTLLLLVLILPLLAAAPSTQPTLDDKTKNLAGQWKERFQEEDFTHIVAPPYVIAGNGSLDQLLRYKNRSIFAAQEALQAMFFKTPPAEPILILLFEDEKTYRRLAKKWLNDTSVPHYGYFRRDRIMVMNVATGTGTLVHELAHALIAPDFPTIPSWANEGLASLYEQCNINGPRIRGLVNWRLPALQRAIRDNKLRPFSEMIEDDDFYKEANVGLNYAQARYLMLYLQEQNKLVDFYKDWRDHAGEDETGVIALERVIAPQSLKEFEATWRKWVLGLRFE